MPVDFSQLSTEDLQALKSGDMTKVSTAGLQSLSGKVPPAPETPSHVAAGVGDIAETAGSALARGVPNAVQDLYRRITGTGPTPPGQEIAGQAKLGPAGNDLVSAAQSVLPKSTMTPQQQAMATAGSDYPTGAAGDIARNVSGVAGDVANLAPPVAGAFKGALAVADLAASGGSDAATALGFRGVNAPGKLLAGESAGPALHAHNAAIGDAAIGNEAGLAPGTTPSYEALEAARQAPGEVMNRAGASLPNGGLDETAQNAVKTAGAPAGGRVSQGSPQAQAQIETLRSQLLGAGPETTGQNWTNELRALRQEGFTNSASDDVSNQQLGGAQLDMANAVEGHVGRNLPANGDVSLSQLQDARKALAKNYTAQSALRGDTFDLPAIARIQRADPQMLDGNMKTAADFANANPEAVRPSNPLTAPSMANDIASLNTAKPIGSILQAVGGGLGRRMLTGGTPGVLQRTNAMFGPRPNFAPLNGGMRPPPGTAGIPPQQGSLGDLVQPPESPQPPSGMTYSGMGSPPAPQTPPGGFSLADLLSHGVENNASGESAASLEAINRGTKNLAYVDQSGAESPVLRGVEQADASPPHGGLIVDKDTGEIVKRHSSLNQAAANGLRNRWMATRALGTALGQ